MLSATRPRVATAPQQAEDLTPQKALMPLIVEMASNGDVGKERCGVAAVEKFPCPVPQWRFSLPPQPERGLLLLPSVT